MSTLTSERIGAEIGVVPREAADIVAPLVARAIVLVSRCCTQNAGLTLFDPNLLYLKFLYIC